MSKFFSLFLGGLMIAFGAWQLADALRTIRVMWDFVPGHQLDGPSAMGFQAYGRQPLWALAYVTGGLALVTKRYSLAAVSCWTLITGILYAILAFSMEFGWRIIADSHWMGHAEFLLLTAAIIAAEIGAGKRPIPPRPEIGWRAHPLPAVIIGALAAISYIWCAIMIARSHEAYWMMQHLRGVPQALDHGTDAWLISHAVIGGAAATIYITALAFRGRWGRDAPARALAAMASLSLIGALGVLDYLTGVPLGRNPHLLIQAAAAFAACAIALGFMLWPRNAHAVTARANG